MSLSAAMLLNHESYLLAGKIDGVCVNETLHTESMAKVRESCKRKPTIVQLAHGGQSESHLQNKIFTRMK